MFRNVLLGLDFSPEADHALDEAIALAERHGGRLTILTAIPEVRGWAGGPCETVTAARDLNLQLEADAVALQHRALERVPACLPVRTIIRRAPARAALLEALDDGCYDGLVLGASKHQHKLRLSRSLTRCLVARGGVLVLVAVPGAPATLHRPGGEAAAPEPSIPAAAPTPALPPRSAPST
jgi:nucleotide-binding universal stress UspA family protein